MWFISVDGLSAYRGSMPCMWEGLIRRFIFKVRLSGPFEWGFCRYFRLILGILEWRHHLQIASMLLLSDPRGTCRCGQKNDWLCICHYLGFCGGELDPRSPPFLFCCCFVVVVIELLYSILLVFLLLVFLLERRHLTRRLEEDQDQGKILNHIWQQERG